MHLIIYQLNFGSKLSYINCQITNGIYINNKKIIPQSDITATIKHLWFNPLYGGVGINRFYDHIKIKYIGITKQAVKDFLNSLESYQLHKRLIKVKTVNPIVPTAPNHYYQLDLINMSKYSGKNNNYNWILTILDIFTKKQRSCNSN